jgi:hypothetical protein
MKIEAETTYPLDAVRRLADHLCDLNYNLPQDEAFELATDLVIDVTLSVDRLRASERAA